MRHGVTSIGREFAARDALSDESANDSEWMVSVRYPGGSEGFYRIVSPTSVGAEFRAALENPGARVKACCLINRGGA